MQGSPRHEGVPKQVGSGGNQLGLLGAVQSSILTSVFSVRVAAMLFYGLVGRPGFFNAGGYHYGIFLIGAMIGLYTIAPSVTLATSVRGVGLAIR